MAAPNDKFIEILPEVSYKIGSGLKSPAIARPAFAILVSEEAMIIASRLDGNWISGKPTVSRFFRHREHNDETTVSAIEAAAYSFQARVQGVMDKLIDEDMAWLDDLSVFAKLREFEVHCPPDKKSEVRNYISTLRDYIRANILGLLTEGLPSNLSKAANCHRRAEQYLKPMDFNFDSLWETLAVRERIMTKFFWLMVRDFSFASVYTSSLFEKLPPIRSLGGDRGRRNVVIEKEYGVKRTNFTDIKITNQHINTAIFKAIKEGGYNKGEFPDECYPWGSNADISPAWKKQSTTSAEYDPTRSPSSAPYHTTSIPEVGSIKSVAFATQEQLAYYKTVQDAYAGKAAHEEPFSKRLVQQDEREDGLERFQPILPIPSNDYGSPFMRHRHNGEFPKIEAGEGSSMTSKRASEDPLSDRVGPIHEHASGEVHTEENELRAAYEKYDEEAFRKFFNELPDRSRPLSSIPDNSNKQRLLTLDSCHPPGSKRTAIPESPTSTFKSKSYVYAYYSDDLAEASHLSTLNTSEEDDSEIGASTEDQYAFDADLISNMNSRSGKVILSQQISAPITIVQGASKQKEKTLTTARKNFASDNREVLSRGNRSSQARMSATIDKEAPEARRTANSTGFSPSTKSTLSPRRGLFDFEDFESPENATTFASPTSHGKRKSDASDTPQLPRVSSKPVLPAISNITTISPFFSIEILHAQVSNYLRTLALTMLSAETDINELTDTLLCLTDAEYKFLPLWAGGNDDGSGGVVDTDMPPAIHGGPSGPGPSYHTGSTVGSRASSVVDWGMTEAATSVGVENGESDHIDRRKVVSEDGFGDASSITFSDDTVDYEIEREYEVLTPVMTSVEVDYDNGDDDDDFMNLSDEELELDDE